MQAQAIEKPADLAGKTCPECGSSDLWMYVQVKGLQRADGEFLIQTSEPPEPDGDIRCKECWAYLCAHPDGRLLVPHFARR
jgi:DNA-directed RNA polymerase subunit RPC12/RpoP